MRFCSPCVVTPYATPERQSSVTLASTCWRASTPLRTALHEVTSASVRRGRPPYLTTGQKEKEVGGWRMVMKLGSKGIRSKSRPGCCHWCCRRNARKERIKTTSRRAIHVHRISASISKGGGKLIQKIHVRILFAIAKQFLFFFFRCFDVAPFVSSVISEL